MKLETHLKTGLKYRPGSWDIEIIKESAGYKELFLNVPKNFIALDVGAHIGTFTKKAIEHGASIVYAFEPNPDNAKIFRQNFKKDTRARFFEAALISGRGSVELYVNEKKNTGSHSLEIKRGRTTIKVNALDINSIIENYQPHIIKIDVEGSEFLYDWNDIFDKSSNLHSLAVEIHLGKKEWRSKKAPELIRILEKQKGFEFVKPPRLTKANWFTLAILRKKN